MKNLRKFLEPTLLDSQLSATELSEYMRQIKSKGDISGITVPSFWVKKTVMDLEGTDLMVSTVVGYPHGFQQSIVKVTEAKESIKQGALGINMVWSQTAYVSGMTWSKIEVAQLAKLCHDEGCLLTVMLDLDWIKSQNNLMEISNMIQDAGADYVMLGLTGEINIEQEIVEHLRKQLSSQIGLKAFWDGKSEVEAEKLIEAGIDRLHYKPTF